MPRCPACRALAACSDGTGCSPPRRDPTDPTRPCSQARPPWRQGRRDPPVRDRPRSPRRGSRRCPARRSAPAPVRRMPGAIRGPQLFRPRAALRRSGLPTTRSWVSTTTSARNISHSTAQTARIARRRLSGSSRSPSAKWRFPCRRNRVIRCGGMEEAFRRIEAPDVLEAVQQPVGVGGIAARLEQPVADEPRHASVGRLFEQRRMQNIE